jgi:hypothetical protein
MSCLSKVAALFLIIFSLFVFSCAFDLAHVKYNNANFIGCKNNCREIHVKQEVQLNNLPCNYNRVIKKDTVWQQVGVISEGKVFKPLNQSFTVECSNIFEAYLVMDDTRLNGFFLPVQDGFVALKNPVQIPLE